VQLLFFTSTPSPLCKGFSVSSATYFLAAGQRLLGVEGGEKVNPNGVAPAAHTYTRAQGYAKGKRVKPAEALIKIKDPSKEGKWVKSAVIKYRRSLVLGVVG